MNSRARCMNCMKQIGWCSRQSNNWKTVRNRVWRVTQVYVHKNCLACIHILYLYMNYSYICWTKALQLMTLHQFMNNTAATAMARIRGTLPTSKNVLVDQCKSKLDRRNVKVVCSTKIISFMLADWLIYWQSHSKVQCH